MTSSLEQLKAIGTTVVCDSGDFATIGKYKPQDATTNPSLILAASKKTEYAKLMDVAVGYGKDHVSVSFLWKHLAGTDNRALRAKTWMKRSIRRWTACSSNSEKRSYRLFPEKFLLKSTLAFLLTSKALSTRLFTSSKQVSISPPSNWYTDILQLYKDIGIDKSRVLIKLASTWEGIKAAHILQSEHGVNCNLTLMFSLPQAIAAAEAGAFLISPFVGRILDWYKAANKRDYTPQEDPGVKSVQQIFNYYKKFGYKTIVMGASFRNVGEITELAGCDYLTISVRRSDLSNNRVVTDMATRSRTT